MMLIERHVSAYSGAIIRFNILSPIACWTWWWPQSRPKHVVQLTSFITDQLVVFLTSLHYTFMLHTKRGCLNSRQNYSSVFTRTILQSHNVSYRHKDVATIGNVVLI